MCPRDESPPHPAAAAPAPGFACDAMLGGLARWLRAAGYDASWRAHIADAALIQEARDEGRVLLSADTGIFQFRVIRDGIVPALFVPLNLSPEKQLAHVLAERRLPLREPRCMACGGALRELAAEEVGDRVPPRTRAWLSRFWECVRCNQVFWHGSHWEKIVQRLREAAAGGV